MKYCTEIDLTSIKYEVYSTKQKKNKKTYINIESGFDIETTSMMYNGEKTSFMYEWTWGIQDKEHIYYGRTWEEFINLCYHLQEYFDLDYERKILIIYVHNLSFEFQFMRKYFNWVNVFSTDERKPLKALTDFGIEFRDSLILSGMSLAKTAENLVSHKVEKLTGDLNYSLIRTYKTSLSQEELNYCENDVLIILYYINEQITQFGNITKIPATNTGKVRLHCRNKCYYDGTTHSKNTAKYNKYKKLMNVLQINNAKEYKMLKRAFQGGFTHANPFKYGKVIKDVRSMDFTSSYPAVMLSEEFPMSRGIYLDLRKNSYKELVKKYCIVMRVIYTNLQSKNNNENYISSSRCEIFGKRVINNGRVYSAEKLDTTITNVDVDIIEACYSYDSREVKLDEVIGYKKGYLPKEIIESILELYESKTELKGVESKEVEYLVSKGMLNSIYGMCVTDIVHDDIVYNGDEWKTEKADLEKGVIDYNNKIPSRFLFYPWGVFVTAYARRNLWTGILELGNDYIYSDTDSVKFTNYEKRKKYFDSYNKDIERKLNLMCDTLHIDRKRVRPCTIKGKEKLIGVWDDDGVYKNFKTLGAKRYLTEDLEGELHLTVAGLAKKNGIEYMKEQCNNDNTKVFDMFNDKLFIPSDKTGKMTHTYIDDEMELLVKDYQGNTAHIITKSGIHLENCEFTLDIAKEYSKFISDLLNGYLYIGLEEWVNE